MSLATLFILLSSSAIAATNDTVVSELSELNVVAMKQETALRNKAVSATLLSTSAIDRMNAVSLKGVSDAVPNFYMPDYGSRVTSSIYVRGIGARMDQPAVGLNVDNVSLLNKNAFDFDVADIESVEMLRGPQSTLYGRNTMGGLISIRTLSPMRWQGWRIMASAANHNDYRASLGWYHKFKDSFASSISANFSYLGGFYKNLYNDQKLDKEKSGGVRIRSNWRMSDKWYFQNVLATSILRQGGYPYEYIGTGEINYNDTCFYRRFLLNDGLSFNYRGKDFNLTSVTSVQYLDDNLTLDQDFLPLPYFTLTQKQQDLALTEDLFVRQTKMDGKYHLLTGLFGFYKHLNMQAPVVFKDEGIRSLIESHRNESNPTYPITWNTRQFPLNSEFTIPVWGVSVYHESKFTLGNFDLTAGLRLEYEHSGLDYHSLCDTGYQIWDNSEEGVLKPFRNVKIDIDEYGQISRKYINWMPKLNVLWRMPKELGNIYLSVTKGYKSGGFNTQMFSEVLQQRLMHIMGIGSQYDVDQIVGYRPEYSWNYEIGSHLSFLENRLTGDVSLFYIDCHDQQLTVFPSGTTTGRMMTNAGKTRSIGGELSLYYIPASWVQFNGSMGYTDAKFVKYNNGIQDFKGKFLPYVPNTTVYLQAVFTKHFSNRSLKSLSFDINLRNTGRIYWNETNDRKQNGYSLLGASFTAQVSDVELSVWGKNLTGTKYDTFYFMSMGNEFLQRGRPWQIGATLRIAITQQ